MSGLLALPRIGRASLILAACGWATAAQAAFTVFACEPEWAALVRVLVPQAQVHVATSDRQDPHHIEARPALIAQLRQADLAVCTGAELEVGWLPMLQERAANAKVQDGQPGMFYAAQQVTLLDPRPGHIAQPFAGDVHADGNPHFQLDPRRLGRVAAALSQRLQALQPQDAVGIAQRAKAFEAQWQRRIEQWRQQAEPLRGQAVAAQHTTFAYLWEWLGLRQVADLEPKPGMAPTPGHLQGLLQRLRPARPMAVVVSGYQDPRAARWLSEQLGGDVPPLVLASTVADPLAPDALVRWMDSVIDALVRSARR